MNKQEASTFLKTLLTECKLGSNSFILLEPNPEDTLSSGYKIRIKTIIDNDCRQQIKGITKKHDLAVVEEQNQIIVYKPKSNHSDHLILR
jgi:hypothetical protein